MVYSALVSRELHHHGKYSSRQGRTPNKLVPHHWAGISGGDARLLNPNQEVSVNYIIYSTGEICVQVPEEYRPWTSGNFEIDSTAITFEVQNSSGQVNGNDDDPLSWQISAEALDAVIRLSADIAARYKWGALAESNLIGHRQVVQTSCPGGYFWRQFPKVRAEANRILNGGVSTPVPATPPAASKTVWQLADEVMAGVHGSGADRERSLGAQYQEVQNEVNRRFGVSTPAAPIPASKSIAQWADEVIAGAHGSGADRQARLGGMYNEIQAEVNRRLGASQPAPQAGPSISQLADAVLRGEFGDGADRQARLGTNYNAVQAEVNRRFS